MPHGRLYHNIQVWTLQKISSNLSNPSHISQKPRIKQWYITNYIVMIAEVDCTVHKSVCASNAVKGYPSVKLFVKGQETIDYKGARTEEGFIDFIKEKMERALLCQND